MIWENDHIDDMVSRTELHIYNMAYTNFVVGICIFEAKLAQTHQTHSKANTSSLVILTSCNVSEFAEVVF